MPSTIVNPPPPPDDIPGGPASPESRLSDVVKSVHHTPLDLTMPALTLAEWDTLGTASKDVASIVAAQSALLTAQNGHNPAQAVQYSSPDLPAVAKLHKLFGNRLNASNILATAKAKANELDELLREARTKRKTNAKAKTAVAGVPKNEGWNYDLASPRDLAETIAAGADVARFLRKRYLANSEREIDLRTGWYGIRDQRKAAGCVGWAVADLLWRQRNKRVDVPSARFIWQAAKELDAEKRPTTMIAGAGTSLRAALRLVKLHGFALESELPSDSDAPYNGSLDTFYETIGTRKVSAFINLGNDVKNRLAWLSLGRPIVCTLRVGRNFVDVAGPDVIVEPFNPKDPTAFAQDDGFSHAVVIVGYQFEGKDLRGAVAALDAKEDPDPRKIDKRPADVRFKEFPLTYLVRNSAGITWGDRGYARIRHVDFFHLFNEEYGVFTSDKELKATSLKAAAYRKKVRLARPTAPRDRRRGRSPGRRSTSR
jgi:hypothetical protein